jgi:hypothetical protein
VKLAVAQIDSASASDVACSTRQLYVAVQRYIDRPADDDCDQAAMLTLINPERPGLLLRVSDAGDDALVDRRIADAVDDDVIAFVL